MENSDDGKNSQYNKSYDNYNDGRPINNKQFGTYPVENIDNISEKANSVQTSYKYRGSKKGPNSQSSKGYNYPQDDDDISIEMSENDNLICPNCINYTLIEEKKRREELEKEKEKELNKKYERDNEYTNALFDNNRNRERDMLDERRRQREHNTNEAIQNLAKINEALSNKEKELIECNNQLKSLSNKKYIENTYIFNEEDNLLKSLESLDKVKYFSTPSSISTQYL